MTTSVTDLAAAIGKKLTDGGIRSEAYLSDNFTPPVALVGIQHVHYHEAFGNPPMGVYTFTVFLIVARTADRANLAALEGYMSMAGATSVRQLLEADQTLGGTSQTCTVVDAGPPAAITISNVEYISCPFTVEVNE